MHLIRFRTVASIVLTVAVGAWIGSQPLVEPRRELLEPRSELLRIVVYTWALSTGSIDVDCRTGRLEGFTHRVRGAGEYADGQEPYRGLYRVSADLQPGELAALADIVRRSGLRDFVPSTNDVRHREAYLDECPPTLVLIWADRKQVLGLPLYNTVRSNLPADRLSSYLSMEELFGRMYDLRKRYAEPPYISRPSDSEYDRYDSERDRLLSD